MTMQVRMLRSVATGAGVLNPGALVIVPDALARAWVERGLAVYADEVEAAAPEEVPAVAPAETEVAGPSERSVVLPTERRRRRSR